MRGLGLGAGKSMDLRCLLTLIVIVVVCICQYWLTAEVAITTESENHGERRGSVTMDEEGRYAYVTFVANDNNPHYLHAAAVLVHSLKQSHCKYPIVAMVIENRLKKETEDWLLHRAMFDAIVHVPAIAAPHQTSKENWSDTYTKLNLWGPAFAWKYDKLVFLDSDTLVIQSIDDLFDKYSELSAAIECCGLFNTGVMVLRPSLATFEKMTKSIQILPSYDNADGGFLNSYFRENGKFTELPFIYNALQTMYLQTPTAFEYFWDDIRVIHYMGEKPWNNKASSTNKLHSLWISSFDDIKDHL